MHSGSVQLEVGFDCKHNGIPCKTIYAMSKSALCNRAHGTLTVPHAVPHAHASPTEIRQNDFCNCAPYIIIFLYFLIDEALLFLASAVFAFSSLTRVCRILAYSVCAVCQFSQIQDNCDDTYRGILGCFRATALDCDSVTLVLKTLWCDETLDLWCLGVWLRSLLLWGDLTTDNELADLRAKTGTSDSIQLHDRIARTGEDNLHHPPC